MGEGPADAHRPQPVSARAEAPAAFPSIRRPRHLRPLQLRSDPDLHPEEGQEILLLHLLGIQQEFGSFLPGEADSGRGSGAGRDFPARGAVPGSRNPAGDPEGRPAEGGTPAEKLRPRLRDAAGPSGRAETEVAERGNRLRRGEEDRDLTDGGAAQTLASARAHDRGRDHRRAGRRGRAVGVHVPRSAAGAHPAGGRRNRGLPGSDQFRVESGRTERPGFRDGGRRLLQPAPRQSRRDPGESAGYFGRRFHPDHHETGTETGRGASPGGDPGSRRGTPEADLAPPGDQQRASLDGQADQRRGDERHRPVKAARPENRLRQPHPFPEQPCPGHRRGDPRRDRTRWAVHRKAHRAADPGGLERTAAALRLPGTVIAGTAWRQEKSCRLFAFLGPCGAGLRQGAGTGRKAGRGAEDGGQSGRFRAGSV